MNNNKITNTAGVILAGGRSSRFGSNKALAPIKDKPLVQHVAETVKTLFEEALLVTNTPETYLFVELPSVADKFPGDGPLAGIHAALKTIKSPRAFISGCDMPNLNPQLIRHLCSINGGWQAVIPRHSMGIEPLHAIYHKDCMDVLEQYLAAGIRKIGSVLEKLQVRWVDEEEILSIVPDLTVFHNVNRPDDLPV